MARSRVPALAGASCSSRLGLPAASSASRASTGWPSSLGSIGLRERSPGDPVDWHEGTRHYIYSVYGVSTDYDELLEIDRFLHEEVSIVYE